MARRLSVKYRKRRRDLATAYKKGESYSHKVATARSRKAKLKKANPMT